MKSPTNNARDVARVAHVVARVEQPVDPRVQEHRHAELLEPRVHAGHSRVVGVHALLERRQDHALQVALDDRLVDLPDGVGLPRVDPGHAQQSVGRLGHEVADDLVGRRRHAERRRVALRVDDGQVDAGVVEHPEELGLGGAALPRGLVFAVDARLDLSEGPRGLDAALEVLGVAAEAAEGRGFARRERVGLRNAPREGVDEHRTAPCDSV
jgi:hypothetical protein